MRVLRTRTARALLGTVAAVGLSVLGVVGFTGTAGATVPKPALDCKTVSGTITDRPDNGHGHGGSPADGNWAKVSGIRTITVCTADVSVPATAKVAVQDATFHAVVKDKGTFVTLGGDHLSPNNGVKLVADVHGAWEGGFQATFQAPRPTAKGVWPNFTPAVIDGKTFVGTAGPKTGEWVSKLWTGVEFSKEINWTDEYSWSYTTCNERWVDGEHNDDGQADGPHGAGDITGLSRFPGACAQVSFLDKCDGVQVTLGNQAPTDATVLTYLVNGVKHDVKGGTNPTVLTVDADAHGLVVVKSHGHHDWVHKYVKPACTTPSPGTTPTVGTTPTTTPSLPVTGPAAAIYGGGAVALLAVGVVLYVVARRRRVRFEA